MSTIYVSTTYFGDGSQVQDALRDLEKLKIKNIELGSNHSPSQTNVLKLRKDKNYVVHNYFPPFEKDFILNIASTRPQIKEKSIKFIKNSILWCHKNNVRYYTIHPGFLAEAIAPLGNKGVNRNFDLKFRKKSTPGKNRKIIIEETVKIIRDLYYFAAGQVQLLIENQGSKTSKGATIFDSIEELQLLKRGVEVNLKFNFNLAHASLSGINLKNKDIFGFIYKNSPFFEVSEIKGIYDSHLPLLPGNGSVLEILKNFKDLFKKRNIILEYRNIQRRELLKSFDFINEIFT